MKKLKNFYLAFALTARFYTLMGLVIFLFISSFIFDVFNELPYLIFGLLITILLLDTFILFRKSNIKAERVLGPRLSNGDDNPVYIWIKNNYPFAVNVNVLDELPAQFQIRDFSYKLYLKPSEKQNLNYHLKPLKRGIYNFGNLRIFITSAIKLVERRYSFNTEKDVAVYPSYLQMRRYELMAISNKLTEIGVKKIRKIGNSSEFDQIKNYVIGDDYRHINWKATARKGDLMLNNYIDEKSQHIYCIIDKSRNMQSPFEGLSLLDYAINATLALSNIALLKEDKAGIITLAEKEGAFVPSDRKPAHITKILEVLYKEKTRYLELNSEQFYLAVRNKIKQRSLLVFFTNFESLSAMRRQLPYLKKIARFHLLLVVFFENTEITNSLKLETKNTQDVYFKTIAEQFVNEKRQIVKELNLHGITSILTTPQKLTVNSINAYLRLKSSQKL